MDNEEKVVGDLKLMFASDGWKAFLSNVEGEVELLNNITSIGSADELFFRKGQIAVLSSILNYETQLEAVAYEAA